MHRITQRKVGRFLRKTHGPAFLIILIVMVGLVGKTDIQTRQQEILAFHSR